MKYYIKKKTSIFFRVKAQSHKISVKYTSSTITVIAEKIVKKILILDKK